MLNNNLNYKKSLICTSLLLAFGVASNTWAGATFDGTTGSNTSTLSGDFTVTESDGTLAGSNLFHSFSDFSINAGESATFTGTSPINNVVSRVTGTEASTFNGALTSTITGANFYFMNPNGIIFKEGASISVDGSFYATTSNYIGLGDDGIFNADSNTTSTLTSSPPTSFGFLNNNVGQITFQGTQLAEGINFTLPDGATFAVIGGDINIEQASEDSSTLLGGFGVPDSTGSLVSLQGNQFDIVSVASAGEVVPVNGGYDLSSFATLGNVSITGGSIIDANEIYIRGGNVIINDSMIAPGYMALLFGLPQANGGTIDIAATEQFSITGTAPMNTFFSQYLGVPGGGSFLAGITTFAGVNAANSATVNISGGNIVLSGAAEIKSTLKGTGTAGDINITGADISLSNTAAIKTVLYGDPLGGTAANINISGDNILVTDNANIRGSRTTFGTAGDINISGNLVEVLNGSLIANTNTFFGAGGNINIDASQIILDDQDTTSISDTGLSTVSDFNTQYRSDYGWYYAYADAGSITLNATGPGGLTVKNGAYINTESRSFGSAGDITITASNIDLSRDGNKTGGSIASQSGFAGDAGDITIASANDINIASGFEISATTVGTGDGGDIVITATNDINIFGENSGIASAAPEPIDAVKDYLAYVMLGSEATFSDLVATFNLYGLSADANMMEAVGFVQNFFAYPNAPLNPIAGNAGSITLTASTLKMSDPSRITSSTSSDGNGGTINIQVDKLEMEKDAEIRSRSGLYVNDELKVDSGNGGDITITANESVSMKSGSSISSSSLGEGLAGNIYLNAGDELTIKDSSITTQATIADGGNITIRAIDMIYLDQSDITTSVENGLGSGGNIDIDPEFFILRGSNILANAYGGDGGNIVLVAKHFITSADSSIDASSALGMDGSIDLSSPDEEVADDLVVLSDNYLDVTSLISERCGASSGSSSLVDAGSTGMSVDPDGYLPSYAIAEAYVNNNRTANKTNSMKNFMAFANIDKSQLSIAQLSCNAI